MSARGALADAEHRVLWLDDPERPGPTPPLEGDVEADLAVVGGGYTGLWSAVLATQRAPGSRVVLLESGRVGEQASGRNGGFAAASLTHGFGNGLARWPDEIDLLDDLGRRNLDEIEEFVARHRIDCAFERTGELTVATRPHEVGELAQAASQLRAHGHDVALLDPPQARALVDSPTYLGGLLDPSTAMVEPARLAWGLASVARAQGVSIHELTPATGLRRAGNGVRVLTPSGSVLARRVVLGTNAFRPLLRRLRLTTVPVYDHVLATEPLTPSQRASVGWSGRQGVGDAGNLFHYYRLTREHRVVWGGYDAVYHWGSSIAPAHERRERTERALAEHFLTTFPQLDGVRFTHRWAGVIDTSTRFSAVFGTAWGGRVGYALGYTGLGVAATRFGAQVVLDLLEGRDSERTRLGMVRRGPVPFPPEPVRSAGINLTRWSLARADQREGRRNAWLRVLDRLGLGFDS